MHKSATRFNDSGPAALRNACLLALGILILPGWASAKCSRTIVMPSAPTGVFIKVGTDNEVGGLYPEMFRAIGRKIGCNFEFPVVPRARIAMLFERGEADILVPATQTVERDKLGSFIPMTRIHPVLITSRSDLAIRSLDDLLKNPALRVNVVRGYDMGPAYMASVKSLADKGMVEEVVSPQNVVKKMALERADIAILTSHIFYASVVEEGLEDSVGAKARYLPQEWLGEGFNGVYLSNAVPASDQAQIRAAVSQFAASGDLWRELRKLLPEKALTSIQPLDKSNKR